MRIFTHLKRKSYKSSEKQYFNLDILPLPRVMICFEISDYTIDLQLLVNLAACIGRPIQLGLEPIQPIDAVARAQTNPTRATTMLVRTLREPKMETIELLSMSSEPAQIITGCGPRFLPVSFMSLLPFLFPASLFFPPLFPPPLLCREAIY